ncbi:MAG: class I SAM-dependent methyltransferase [Phycisphaerales bacterium]|nr:class I SAM-dependent methyltransferase [Phycisphaerales bacterium]MCI0674223.1 class I SAM-dependent methyltransferase [Phycisphaerales bacterium]
MNPNNPDQRDTCPACGGSPTGDRVQAVGFDICRCSRCGLRYVPAAQLPKSVDYNDLYQPAGDYAHHVEEVQGLKSGLRPRPLRARRMALEIIKRLNPTSLLEVGCGVGNFLAHIRDSGIRAYGIDVSANAIELARQHLDCPLVCGVLDDHVFDGEQFDVICSWEVLEHVPDPKSFTASIFRRLNPGGAFFLSTPNYGSSWMRRDIPADPLGRPPVHITFWDTGSLKGHLLGAGFGQASVRAVSYPLNAAQRTGGELQSKLMFLDCMLRPSQRRTLLAHATKSPAT